MAEVLSQSQIDALLSAVRSGEKDMSEGAETKQEKKYRKYDFYSPRKFTKDKIKMLSGIFENYTRLIGSRLNGLLRVSCEVSVDSVEEQQYREFSNALTEGNVLSLVQVDVKGKPPDELPVLYHISTPIALSMIDHMMGGEGDIDDDASSGYQYTDIEFKLYEKIIEDIIPPLGSCWENYIAVDFVYERTEINPTFVQILRPDETVVIVGLKIQFPNGMGQMSICLPGSMLTNIFNEISKEQPGKRAQDVDHSEEIFDDLRDTELEIKAQIGGTQLSLSDVYHLSVGDVVDLGQPKDSPVYLEIGGYNWFSGRMGVHKKNMAVKIDDVCYQAEIRSE